MKVLVYGRLRGAADWRAEREAASTGLPKRPAASTSRSPNENGCPAGTEQPKSSAFDVAHQNSRFPVRAPVAARSRLGAARCWRVRSRLGVARLIPENPDSAPGCRAAFLCDDTLRKVTANAARGKTTGSRLNRRAWH